jgi:signal transduction histidine kinase
MPSKKLFFLSIFISLSFGIIEYCFGDDRIFGAVNSKQASKDYPANILTIDEREWLANHPKISIAPDPIFLPIEFIDSKGNYSGIAADYISLIEKKLGINFEKVSLKNWDEVLKKTKKREVDMWGAATPTSQRLEYMLFTDPFLKLPAVILVRKQVNENLTLEAIKGMKVVVISGYGIHDYIKKKYPNFNLEVVPDIQTGLKKVSFGMADAMVVNIALATHYIEEEGITNLRIAGDSGYVYEWAFASRKDWPELRNIMGKGLSLINQEERKSIYRKWVNLKKDSWISIKYVFLIFVLALLMGGVISILALNRRLKKQVQARTQDLERSNQELQSFASIASHDLQEPLRKIVTLGDRLSTLIPEANVRGKDYLHRMQNSALRMRNLVEDLLQYTRIDFKARPFESLDLNKVVATVLDDLETRIRETQGAIDFKNLPVIKGDPVQIHQLFLNLIGNALKFHREGIPPVVNLDASKIGNGLWEISVEDNGIGIDEEHIDKIFQPFERLHGRTTYEGTGIGLTICNKIVSRHGGKITVKRQSTNGVTFHITLSEKQNNGEVI